MRANRSGGVLTCLLPISLCVSLSSISRYTGHRYFDQAWFPGFNRGIDSFADFAVRGYRYRFDAHRFSQGLEIHRGITNIHGYESVSSEAAPQTNEM